MFLNIAIFIETEDIMVPWYLPFFPYHGRARAMDRGVTAPVELYNNMAYFMLPRTSGTGCSIIDPFNLTRFGLAMTIRRLPIQRDTMARTSYTGGHQAARVVRLSFLYGLHTVVVAIVIVVRRRRASGVHQALLSAKQLYYATPCIVLCTTYNSSAIPRPVRSASKSRPCLLYRCRWSSLVAHWIQHNTPVRPLQESDWFSSPGQLLDISRRNWLPRPRYLSHIYAISLARSR